MKHRIFATALYVACGLSATVPVLAIAPPALAAETGHVDATVKDALGRPLAGVALRLEDAQSQPAATGTTDDQGRCTLPDVAPGVYSLMANKPDFQPGLAVVTVSPGGTTASLLTLASLAALSLEVQTAKLDRARTGIQTQTGSSVTHIDRQTIAELPKGEDTSVNQVLLQSPGVVQDTFGQIHVRGDHGNVQYRVNGIVIPEGIAGFGNNFDARFIDHMDLLTGALPAEFGYRTAGVVDITTKSGVLTPGGKIDLQGGSNLDLEPSLQFGGSAGPVDYFLTGSYVRNSLGIENVTPDAVAIHDNTVQGKAFGYGSALINPTTRLSAIAGTAVQTFEIPTLAGQTPTNTLAGVAAIPSENVADSLSPANHFGVLALQGTLGEQVDYQLAGFVRYSSLQYTPDTNGDLQYSGLAANIFHTSLLGGVQGDGAYHLNDVHTLRFGLYASAEQANQNDTDEVFPANADGSQASQTPQTISDNGQLASQLLGIYAQDEWKIAQALTLNYGLRFDVEGGFVQTNELEPRIGLVYQPVAGTTLHAGYARYFTPPATELISNTAAAKFDGTTAAIDAPAGTQFLPVPERANYFDAGISQVLAPGFAVNLDGYFKDVTAIQDEGQFGRALVYSVFNYQEGRLLGAELSSSYRHDDFSAYANVTLAQALGQGLLTGQYNFGPAEAAYVANNWIHLDHDQLLSATAGASYNFWGTRVGLEGLFGSGLRSGFDNTETVPAYAEFDADASHTFKFPGFGELTVRGTVLNLLDSVYELRDDSGIGVQAAQYGPRRSYYLGVTKQF